MQRNVSGQRFVLMAFDDDGEVTGDAANISATLVLDGGTPAATTNSASEIGSTGVYTIDATQAETNADQIIITATSSTSDVSVVASPPVIFTTPNYATATVAAASQSAVTISDGIILYMRQGDDYSGDYAITFNVTSASDQSGNSLLFLAKDGDTELAYRLEIVGTVGSQYALMDPAGSVTDNWDVGTYSLLLRLETGTNVEHTIGSGTLYIQPFETPATIVDL